MDGKISEFDRQVAKAIDRLIAAEDCYKMMHSLPTSAHATRASWQERAIQYNQDFKVFPAHIRREAVKRYNAAREWIRASN